LLADHIRTEAGHGWGYIQQANDANPSRDHALPDPEFEIEYGLVPRSDHIKLQQRDFLSYLIAGNLWPYGHCTAATRGIQITNPRAGIRARWSTPRAGAHGKILQRFTITYGS
jgi:hypothetical protein